MDLMKTVEAATCSSKESLCFFPEYNNLVSYEVILGGHIGYLLLIAILKVIMKGSGPLTLKYPMMLYNVVQVGMSVTMTIQLAPFLMDSVFHLDGRFCAKIEFWILVHYLTKFLDMFDSIFMVLRKKEEQLSFLHVYHHTTIGLIWGLLLHFGVANGTAFYGAWINSLVHSIMYFHYLWTSFGLRNPFKKYITQFQMFQFGTCIFHAICVITLDTQIPTFWAGLQLCYHCTLLYLFYNFYQGYAKAAKKSKKN